jgi:hypothetical protein
LTPNLYFDPFNVKFWFCHYQHNSCHVSVTLQFFLISSTYSPFTTITLWNKHLKPIFLFWPPPNRLIWGWPNHPCGPWEWFGHPKGKTGSKKIWGFCLGGGRTTPRLENLDPLYFKWRESSPFSVKMKI